jgi:hypothetical protein
MVEAALLADAMHENESDPQRRSVSSGAGIAERRCAVCQLVDTTAKMPRSVNDQ